MPEIDDVVPGEVVESVWGNDIRDRTVQRYVDAVERDFLNPNPNAGELAYLINLQQVEVFNGTDWEPFETGSAVLKFKAVQQFNFEGQLVDDDTLFFPVPAGEIWIFRMTFVHGSNASGLQVLCTYPPGGLGRYQLGASIDPLDPPTVFLPGSLGDASLPLVIGSGNQATFIDGYVDNTTGGNGDLTLQWAAGDLGGAPSVDKGATLVATQVI